MIFSSVTFLVFFLITMLVVGCVNLAVKFEVMNAYLGMRTRHLVLLVASYVFYGWWDYRFCLLMLLLTVIAYLSSKRLESKPDDRLALTVGIITPLVILGFFKYFNFFLESMSMVMGIENLGTLNIILPVGISFFTFQSMSYTLDVWRGKLRATKGFVPLALYISFFPQLVAGPIIKASDFLPQLEQPERNITLANLGAGMQIFLFGMFKKIVIADYLAVYVDGVFDAPSIYHSGSVLLAVVAYSIQIYFDFSGYSDMAFGCARVLGYDLCRNFNVPYMARNVTEFWKRWHISLSTWLQEYLYYSLGGNRKGRIRTYINLMLTMLLGGLWHGASWNFVIWGGLHGLALIVHKVYSKAIGNKVSDNGLITAISTLATYIFVNVCWVFFRASDFGTAIKILRRIIQWDTGIVQVYTWAIVAIVITTIGMSAAYVYGRRLHRENDKAKRSTGYAEGFYPVITLGSYPSYVLLFLEMGLILTFAYTGSSPFIYFQF